MKKVVLFLVGSMFMVSCGPTAEELVAIEAIQSELRDLKYELNDTRFTKEFWSDELSNDSNSTEVRLYAGEVWKNACKKEDVIEAQITQLKVQLANLK